jgi:hypothetical protein
MERMPFRGNVRQTLNMSPKGNGTYTVENFDGGILYKKKFKCDLCNDDFVYFIDIVESIEDKGARVLKYYNDETEKYKAFSKIMISEIQTRKLIEDIFKDYGIQKIPNISYKIKIISDNKEMSPETFMEKHKDILKWINVQYASTSYKTDKIEFNCFPCPSVLTVIHEIAHVFQKNFRYSLYHSKDHMMIIGKIIDHIMINRQKYSYLGIK